MFWGCTKCCHIGIAQCVDIHQLRRVLVKSQQTAAISFVKSFCYHRLFGVFSSFSCWLLCSFSFLSSLSVGQLVLYRRQTSSTSVRTSATILLYKTLTTRACMCMHVQTSKPFHSASPSRSCSAQTSPNQPKPGHLSENLVQTSVQDVQAVQYLKLETMSTRASSWSCWSRSSAISIQQSTTDEAAQRPLSALLIYAKFKGGQT
ncbi:hypothetical protein BaRGS_00030149 [Batillaria attramentaria]|uniref:Uncharacterized protein n=1 Tax=Batillaria attramentaria TaxID=370345 RepID=A0ABD0JUG2_9CAEN